MSWDINWKNKGRQWTIEVVRWHILLNEPKPKSISEGRWRAMCKQIESKSNERNN